MEELGAGPAGANARSKAVCTTAARFPWTIKYDEVLLVVEGELTVHTAEGALKAGPKDTIFLPKGTALEYEAEDALIFYAIHPANRAGS